MIARIEKRLLEPICLWRVDTGVLLKVRCVWGRSGGRGCGVGFIWIGMGILGVLIILVNTMSVLIQMHYVAEYVIAAEKDNHKR